MSSLFELRCSCRSLGGNFEKFGDIINFDSVRLGSGGVGSGRDSGRRGATRGPKACAFAKAVLMLQPDPVRCGVVTARRGGTPSVCRLQNQVQICT